MQCYKELTAPTAVSYSLNISLTSRTANNLVVAKGSLIQIFSTITISAEVDNAQSKSTFNTPIDPRYQKGISDDDGLESSFLGGEAPFVKVDKGTNTKLILVAEYPVAAAVCGLARVRIPNTKYSGEALLVAMRDAKMTLLGWVAETSSIENLSVHYYEQEDIDGSPWEASASEYDTFLEADPMSRCAALKFGPKNFAILPFRRLDEDIEMDDEWNGDLDGPKPAKGQSAPLASGEKNEVPYLSSYVLKLPQLDPLLLHPVHFAFLHGYREPTFGIISSTQSRGFALDRKDNMSYRVFTLDLQQKASTAILSVEGLPSDIFCIVPLPTPIGGSLLIGDNELIHIDQSGKPKGVAVNGFTREMTKFSLADQSDLNLRLEYCVVEQLAPDSSELLMVLNDGRLALVVFKVDGRTVSGLTVRVISPEQGGDIIPTTATCLTRLRKNSMFIGSDDGDSHVIGWTRKQGQTARRKARLLEDTLDYDMDDLDLDEDEEDDDLYGETAADGSDANSKGDLTFKVQDTLLSIAPIRGMVTGETIPEGKDTVSPLQLALAVGRGRAGAIALVNRCIQPNVISQVELPDVYGFWAMAVRKPVPKSLQGDKGKTAPVGVDFDPDAQQHKFMIMSKVRNGEETSDVYALKGARFELLSGTEFDPDAGFTLEAGIMGAHSRVVQVLRSEIRSYDGDFGLSQIIPMMDEETDAEPQIISASISDPYILLIRDDSSAFIAQMDSNCELEEIEKGQAMAGTKLATGCLYSDVNGIFVPNKEPKNAKTAAILAFFITTEGSLLIYNLPDLETPIYSADGITFVPDIFSPEYSKNKRGFVQEEIKEIVVANLGDRISQSPYLVLRNSFDDLIVYTPVLLPDSSNLNTSLRFAKVSNQAFAKSPPANSASSPASNRQVPLRVCNNVGGYSAIFLGGPSPSFLIKDSKSSLKVVGLQGLGVRGFSMFHTDSCEHGFVYSDYSGVTRVAQLPRANFGLGVSVQKVPIGMNIKQIVYHPPTKTYAIACTAQEPFELPKDDDYHKDWQKENIALKPMVEKSSIRLFEASSWIEVETLDLDQYEVVHAMKMMNLEISEVTKERRQLITLGTSISRGEDLPVRGRIYVFDVVSVIPYPGKPYTNKKLKLIAKEEIPRGAVTAVSEIGTQGLMLLSQGQKCMVRGLKEDGSLLPVSFLDMNCYVTTAKELKGSGLCVMADAFKGVWFTGSTEEPYRMQLFGKSSTMLDIVTADFLPDGDQLFILAAGFDGDVHVLQYDPDDPKSLQGHLLLHRTTFSTSCNGPTSTMLLSRSTSNATDGVQPLDPTRTRPHILLMASPSGMLSTFEALSESSYRRMLSLTVQLINNLPQWAAANPRAFRMSMSQVMVGIESTTGRSIIDGAVLSRWNELSSTKRAELASKVGFAGPEQVREELEGLLGWSGLIYF
ncbi:mRNA cleavage and polyadenylation factor subunit [Ceratocystis pirilliformis]|uniref:mRNA cleavage and polyadenylation factor subunit n=1 Tax=Ceratocystis pirilliformis TaxID=259994 RepID=A0ABR3Z5U3_9PEZI